MAIVTKEDLLGRLNTRFGEDTSDDTLSLIEDISDTMDSLNSSSNEDWRARYEENDAQWRQKYRDRFMNKEETEELETQLKQEERKNLTFDSLFDTK